MKYNCCNFLLHEIVFAQSDVMACCCSPNNKFIKFYKQEDDGIFNIDSYEKIRNFYIKQFQHNIIPDGCIGCSFIKEQEWDDKINITDIVIANRTKCSCNCIYCSLREGDPSDNKKIFLNTRIPYDIKPILKELTIKKYIQKNCNIQIAGGECCEYPTGELEYIIETASIFSCHIEILSSGILYSEAIENALKQECCTLIISTDSGRKSTYEYIKRVNAFDKVWYNIDRYNKATENNPYAEVIIKYILIPEINDSIDEVRAFVDKCKIINCKNIKLAVEYSWYNKNQNNIPNNQLVNSVKYLRNSGLNISYEPQSEKYLTDISSS